MVTSFRSNFWSGQCYPLEHAEEWKIRNQNLESINCEGMVMEIKDASTTAGANIVLAPDNDSGWNQRWSIKSNVARLLIDNEDPNQEWKAVFDQPNYNYALQYGFPGPIDSSTSCLDSTNDKGLAQSAMHNCDKSMSLLLGSTTSVGTLRAVASLVNNQEKGPKHMPGECCMDVATNSDFFGYRVSVCRNFV